MSREPITPHDLRQLADQLQDAAQAINDHLDAAGMPLREVTEARRRHVQPRLTAAGALRNAAGKLGAIVPTSIGDL